MKVLSDVCPIQNPLHPEFVGLFVWVEQHVGDFDVIAGSCTKD